MLRAKMAAWFRSPAAQQGRNAWRRAAVAILFAAALWTSLPRAARMTREAITLAPLSYEQRRDRVLGPFYSSLRTIRAQLRPGEIAGLSLSSDRDHANAVFAAYYLYPRSVRFFGSLDEYRVRVLEDPKHPKRLVRIDGTRGPEVRLMSYNDVRHEEVLAKPLLRELKPGNVAVSEAIVPFALAIDGQPGNAYLTDGVLQSDVDGSATLTFYPTGESKTLAFRAGQPLALRDAAYALAKRLDAGWIRMQASAPVRASFWYVNRGLKHAVALPLFEKLPAMPQRVRGGEKFWVLNPSGESIDVVVNGETHTIDPYALTALPSQPQNEVRSARPVLAFSVDKVNGRERFHFPDAAR